MPFRRDSLAVLQDRIYANYTSLFRPLAGTPRHNLLKVFASVDAGIYHQLLGDLDFLSRQIFPDTAEGDILREHWSAKVPPLYATTAVGDIAVTGIPGRTVPAGAVFASASGERYYTEKPYRLGADGGTVITVKAQTPGLRGNLAPDEKLSITSSIPAGVDSSAAVCVSGIAGGSDAETDEEYLVRVITALHNPQRYGRKGDFALWAMDASAEVSSAWEFYCFGVFGAVLVQVVKGDQHSGLRPVGNLAEVQSYIETLAPPVPFEVRTPEIVPVNPSVSLPPEEDTQSNRETADARLKTFLQMGAKPGSQVTAGALRLALIDGVAITDAAVKIGGSTAGTVTTTVLEYPYIGEITWE